jgi:UPF0716 protein FxsA
MRFALWVLGLGFLVVPVLEVWVLVLLNRRWGIGPTLAMLLATGLAGLWLAKWQGWRTVQRIKRELAAGQMPSAALMDGALILLAGLLLIIPGVLTDVAAFLLLLPPTRYVVRRLLLWWCKRRLLPRVTVAGRRGAAAPDDDAGIIEGRAVSVEYADRLSEDGVGSQSRL